jgi:GNAT superfamily N-acetyltransferase
MRGETVVSKVFEDSAGSFTIEPARAEHAPALAELSEQLGYQATPARLAEWLNTYQLQPTQRIFVARMGGAVIGWVDVSIVNHMITGRYGEIGGLIVSAEHRGRGVGRQLTAKAEGWMREQGVNSCTVRSRTSRPDAHRFYERESYEIVKTSVVFRKDLKG